MVGFILFFEFVFCVSLLIAVISGGAELAANRRK